MNPAEVRAAAVIAEKLRTGLTHPGDPQRNQPPISFPILPFRTHAGMPPKMVEEISAFPTLWGEAIVHAVTTDADAVIVDKTVLSQLEAASQQPGEHVIITCRRCSTPLLRLRVHGSNTVADPRLLAKTLSDHDCT